jgi:hypothetical protein
MTEETIQSLYLFDSAQVKINIYEKPWKRVDSNDHDPLNLHGLL